MSRRNFMQWSIAAFGGLGIGATLYSRAGTKQTDQHLANASDAQTITMSELKNLERNPATVQAIKLSSDDWDQYLDAAQYRVLRKAGTERPGTSILNSEKRTGEYVCAGCGLALFKSETKFESGTGWPSFYQPIDGRLGKSTDFKIGYPRTEYHCARCGGHQGHVFKDGPQPTGLRYCNNGVALHFVPDQTDIS